MDTDVVKAFNAELSSIYDARPPLGKKKIQDISKAALKGKSFYKHVVFSVEKFLGKCKVEYKIPCLYVIDSIIRASKHQFKEKDVYAARFLKSFSKTLSDLLQCPVNEQCRVVRTLNLWVANGVYTEEQMAPFKAQCRDMGIETDIYAVERAVKGSKADLSIYGMTEKTQTPQFEARTPPMPPPSSSAKVATPISASPACVAAQEEPSDFIPEGCISERHLLVLLRQAGCDFNGSFSSDIVLLRKAHAVVCDALRSRQQAELERQKGGNIKNLLSSNFDYSDEEDSGDEGGGRKQSEETEPKPMTLDQVIGLADTLIRDPQVIHALKTMQQEQVARLNRFAMVAQAQQAARNQQQQQHQMQSLPVPPPNPVSGLNVCVPPPGTVSSSLASHMLTGGVPVSLPGLPPGFQLPGGLQGLAGLSGIGGLQLPGFPGLPPVVSSANSGAGHQQTAAQQNAQAQALLGLLSNPMNMSNLMGQPPPNLPFSPNRPMPTGVPPPGANNLDLLKQQKLEQEFLKNLTSGNMHSLPPMGVPPPGTGLMGMAPPGMATTSMDAAAQQQMQMLASVEQGNGDGDETDRSRRGDRKRSRSRERSEHRRKKSKDRKDKDKEKERKKLGLAPITMGVTQVASKTLWFGRLPPNCSDHDIRSAVSSAGEVRRVNIIASKACAYATMDSRKSAFDVINRLSRDMQMKGKPVKVNFAMGNGCKNEPFKAWWDADRGITSVPWAYLPTTMESMCDGAHLDVDSLPMDKQMLFTDTGADAVAIPPAMAVEEDEGMEMSSPQCSPPVATSAAGGPSTPMKPPGPFPPQFMMPPPGMPPPGMPGMPPGMPPPHMQFPHMRMPPGMGRPPMPGQMMMPPPGMSMPPPGQPGTPGGMPPPAGGMNVPPQHQSPFARGGFRGGFRGGRGGFAGRGGFQNAPPLNSGGNQQELGGNGDRPPWQQHHHQPAAGDGSSSASFDDSAPHFGGRHHEPPSHQHHQDAEMSQRRRDVDEGRHRDDSSRFPDRDRERPSRWENKDRERAGVPDRERDRERGERGERRRTRWGDREEEVRPNDDRRAERSREDREDRRRDTAGGDRDRERDRDRDRRDERRERSRSRERSSRRNRSRSRERKSRRERESPRYDDIPAAPSSDQPPMYSSASVNTMTASSEDVTCEQGARNGSAHVDSSVGDDAMVTSTTDVEMQAAAAAAAGDMTEKRGESDKKLTTTCNADVTMDSEDVTRARMMEDDLLESALNAPEVE